MTIREFLSKDYFLLPKYQPPKQDFKITIFKLLDQFISLIDEIRAEHYFEDISEFNLEVIYDRQIRLTSKIKESINCAYDGRPFKAYESLKEGLNSDLKNFFEVMNVIPISPETNFYRIRIHKENYPLTMDNFFHIPFNLRGKVKTQRFSIPGFPSLYLGNSLYVCWEELKRPNINDFQAVRIKSTTTLNVIDLSPTPAHSTPRMLYRFLMTWPLVLASSVTVRNHDDAFKPEYIIPQLLLQWVRETQQVDGIAYQTTNIDYSKSLSKGNFTNFVFPVKENKTRGLCDVLKNKFEITNAISNQLNQLDSAGGSLFYNSEELNNLNLNIQTIEFIQGRKAIYGHSILGLLERQLNSLPTERIDIRDSLDGN
jgi:hypothetical protein